MKFSRLKKAVHVMFYANPEQDVDGLVYDVQVFPNENSFGAGVMQKWVMKPDFQQPAGGNPVNIDDYNIPNNLVEVRTYKTKTSLLRKAEYFCNLCDGSGTVSIYSPETGTDFDTCPECQGTGLNQEGMIMYDVLQPPTLDYTW